MKRSILYLVACLLSLTFFVSCQRTVYCTVPMTYIAFRNASSMADTEMDLYVYHTGGSFAQPVDSFLSIYMRDTDYVNNPAITVFKSSYLLADVEKSPYQFDWKVVLKPSGTTYKVSIRHDDRSVKSDSEDEYYCTDNVFYNVNGQQRVSAGFQNEESINDVAYLLLDN